MTKKLTPEAQVKKLTKEFVTVITALNTALENKYYELAQSTIDNKVSALDKKVADFQKSLKEGADAGMMTVKGVADQLRQKTQHALNETSVEIKKAVKQAEEDALIKEMQEAQGVMLHETLGLVSELTDKVQEYKNGVTSDQKTLAANQKKLARQQKKLATGESNLLERKEAQDLVEKMLTDRQGFLEKRSENLAVENKNLARQQQNLLSDQASLTAEQEQLASEQAAFAAQQERGLFGIKTLIKDGVDVVDTAEKASKSLSKAFDSALTSGTDAKSKITRLFKKTVDKAKTEVKNKTTANSNTKKKNKKNGSKPS